MKAKNKKSKKSEKLWQKDGATKLNPQIEDYTVGTDYILDQELVAYDALASIAHAKMLHKIGVLSSSEKISLVKGLTRIIMDSKNGKFKISKTDEDCHTAIENFLTKMYGDVGKKIHTGRSRNDQVLVALRLHMKEKLVQGIETAEGLVRALESQARKYSKTPMPGYTHMQRAMPSTVSLWLESFSASLKDDLILLQSALKIIDQNPLGSVAGYGENILGLDRKMTSKILKFAKVQENPMYCALSRGKFELLTLQSLSPVMFDLGKLAADLMLFTTKEYGFFSLPNQFTTGSSVMPQKHNYDILELVRANSSLYNGILVQSQNVIDKLPSGYNRDFQLTKEPYLRGTKLVLETIAIMTLVVQNLKINNANLEAACTPELYATEEAYKLVREQKIPFRDAYKIIGKKYL
ncbi:MAG: argininosuccinate lyase [bacterium]|nr:argininosuccinate lyase [bacterium]